MIYFLEVSELVPTDEDDALAIPESQCRMLCYNGGVCKVDPVDGPLCVCKAGFSGPVCETGMW